MKFKLWLTIASCLLVLSGYSQSSFELPDGVDRIRIPFKSIFNLIVLPVNVNDMPLNFILDTGASKSIIFNMAGIDSLNVQKGIVLKISGYGPFNFFDAYYSDNNSLAIENYRSGDAAFLVMANQEINLAEKMGVEINGLIGSDFFKNHLVEIDYGKQEIFVFSHESRYARRLRRKDFLPLKFYSEKPYATAIIEEEDQLLEVDILIDTGNGDAFWLLDYSENFRLPTEGYEDRVGIGMNGAVQGVRTKFDALQLGGYKLNTVTVSIPDRESFKGNPEVPYENLGSIGGEILGRFRPIFDYKNQKLYTIPNPGYRKGFYYNMAGIEVINQGNEIFVDLVNYTVDQGGEENTVFRGQKAFNAYTRKLVKMIPVIIVSYVRPDSPAALAGVEVGDQIIQINGIRKESLNVYKTASQFYKNPNSTIRLKIKRGGKEFKIKFEQKPLMK